MFPVVASQIDETVDIKCCDLSGIRIFTDIRRAGHGHIPIVHIYAPVTAPCDAAAGHFEGP